MLSLSISIRYITFPQFGDTGDVVGNTDHITCVYYYIPDGINMIMRVIIVNAIITINNNNVNVVFVYYYVRNCVVAYVG